MPEEKLKSCPFCGSENVEIARESHRPTPELCEIEGHRGQYRAIPRAAVNDGWLIECKVCGARGPHEYTNPVQSMDKARISWNQRNRSDDITPCKNCVRGSPQTVVGNGITEPPYINVVDCSVFGYRVEPDDFCSYGESSVAE